MTTPAEQAAKHNADINQGAENQAQAKKDDHAAHVASHTPNQAVKDAAEGIAKADQANYDAQRSPVNDPGSVFNTSVQEQNQKSLGQTRTDHEKAARMHQENAAKAAARKRTPQELEAERLAALNAPGVAQREAEYNAALAAQGRADIAAGVVGQAPIGHHRNTDPAKFNTGNHKPYTLTVSVSQTIDGRTIVGVPGEQVNLTAHEAHVLAGKVQ